MSIQFIQDHLQWRIKACIMFLWISFYSVSLHLETVIKLVLFEWIFECVVQVNVCVCCNKIVTTPYSHTGGFVLSVLIVATLCWDRQHLYENKTTKQAKQTYYYNLQHSVFNVSHSWRRQTSLANNNMIRTLHRY